MTTVGLRETWPLLLIVVAAFLAGAILVGLALRVFVRGLFPDHPRRAGFALVGILVVAAALAAWLDPDLFLRPTGDVMSAPAFWLVTPALGLLLVTLFSR